MASTKQRNNVSPATTINNKDEDAQGLQLAIKQSTTLSLLQYNSNISMMGLRLTLLFAVLAARASANLPASIVKQTRRLLNFGSTFGSATQASPYDRVCGHPVFQVTTPWGSPYLNMEKLSDQDEALDAGSDKDKSGSIRDASAADEYRQVALFFMDPDDALAVHGEMSQMEQMANADIRITSSSLGKALRSSANLGNGMLTGFPADPLTGNIKPVQDGGSLRYKIVPPKRQLYYAARCKGKERVGLLSESSSEDAQAAILGNSALEALNLVRRREKRERKIPKKRTAMEAANAHMDGYSGIPVFYAPDMQRKVPRLKQLICGVPRETPLFFNYEDLEDAWSVMKQRNKKSAIPDKPANVEVFNLWDVVTSMERDMYSKEKNTPLSDKALSAIKSRLLAPGGGPDLKSITFVPSSRSIQYKEGITARGNGKARLRPMR